MCLLLQEDETGKQAFLNVYGVRVNTTASFNWTSIAGKPGLIHSAIYVILLLPFW